MQIYSTAVITLVASPQYGMFFLKIREFLEMSTCIQLNDCNNEKKKEKEDYVKI